MSHIHQVNVCASIPQVPEQEGVYIGLIFPQDFDGYLYEDFGFRFLERDIPTEDFRKKRTNAEIKECIQHLTLMRDSCDRTIGKLKAVLRKPVREG
jgi:hypothetical protein